jgi:hypothetical protein
MRRERVRAMWDSRGERLASMANAMLAFKPRCASALTRRCAGGEEGLAAARAPAHLRGSYNYPLLPSSLLTVLRLATICSGVSA